MQTVPAPGRTCQSEMETSRTRAATELEPKVRPLRLTVSTLTRAATARTPCGTLSTAAEDTSSPGAVFPQAGLAFKPVTHAPHICLVRLVLLPQWRPPPTVLPLPVDAQVLAHPSQGGLTMSLAACRAAAEAATGVLLTVGGSDIRGGALRAVKRGFAARDDSSCAATGGDAAAAGARLDGACTWVCPRDCGLAARDNSPGTCGILISDWRVDCGRSSSAPALITFCASLSQPPPLPPASLVQWTCSTNAACEKRAAAAHNDTTCSAMSFVPATLLAARAAEVVVGTVAVDEVFDVPHHPIGTAAAV